MESIFDEWHAFYVLVRLFIVAQRYFLMRRRVPKVCSAWQVLQGTEKYMRSIHVTVGNELVRIRFSANSFKIAFEMGLFETLLPKIPDFAVPLLLCLHHLCKRRIQPKCCFLSAVQLTVEPIQNALRFLSHLFLISEKISINFRIMS